MIQEHLSAAARQFELLDEAWEHSKGSVFYHYRIGPFTLRLIFADSRWAEKLTVSFRHLAVAPVDRPDFTVRLWDCAGAGHGLPRMDWELIHRNSYHGYSDRPFYFHYFEAIDALSAVDISRSVGYFIARDSNALPWWVDASPLQVILHVWLRERGLQLTHTAAVDDGRGAALLCGKGGSGKSTTALACLQAGLNYLGEDYCILEPGQRPRVYSVYQSAKWEQNTRALFPNYEGFIRNTAAARSEKALVYYQDIFPGQIRAQSPIRAVVSLRVGESDRPVLQEQPKEPVLKDLATSTLLQLPFYHPRTITILKELVAQIPTYHLTLGRDLSANASQIRELLSNSYAPTGAE
jgi:hypothetical protein